MIITCEHCTTRFQLDDARIPARGVKVRCSRCKHAFFVKRPDLEAESDRQEAESDRRAVDALARQVREDRRQAADPVAPPAEDRTQALEQPVEPAPEGRTRAEARTQVEMRTQAEERTELLGAVGRFRDEDEESDWQFNEEPEEPIADPEPPGPAAEAAAPADPMGELFAADDAEEAGGDEASLADLGSPDEWDLLGDRAEEDDAAGGPAGPAPAGAETAGPREEPVPWSAAAADATPGPSLHDTETPELEADRPRSALNRALGAAAWAAVALLVLWTAGASVRSRPSAPPGPRSVEVGGLRAEAVQGRIVENAGAGFLLVVRATLRNPGDAPRLLEGPLQVRLLDAGGEPLAAAPVALRPAESDLRLQPFATLAAGLRAGGRELARLPFAPGEGLAVSAVFPEVPDRARAFRFELAAGGRAAGEPVAREPAPERAAPVEPGGGELSPPTSSGTTTSPSPPPSRE